MKVIDIEFVNIQSHEHTRFQLRPGLNFILAEDNNVGKSTIFKVLLCAMQLPNVPSAEVDELIRGTCQNARATFSFEGTSYTMWLFREGGKASRAFFEMHYEDGTTSRSVAAPAELRDAFDIVTSTDGKVVNFNDADSVQLIVQDTPKNDEVLAKVLIDLQVDNIKNNMVRLGREIQQDYKVVRSKYDDAIHTVSTMRYVESVDAFNSEHALLSTACEALDLLQEPCSKLHQLPSAPHFEDIESVKLAMQLVDELGDFRPKVSSITEAVSSELFEHLNECFQVIELLQLAMVACSTRPPKVRQEQLSNAGEALKTLEHLTSASIAMSYSRKAGQQAERLKREHNKLLEELRSVTTEVECPMKGRVLYSDEECIPYSDRPSL